jgi:hypothetical protein
MVCVSSSTSFMLPMARNTDGLEGASVMAMRLSGSETSRSYGCACFVRDSTLSTESRTSFGRNVAKPLSPSFHASRYRSLAGSGCNGLSSCEPQPDRSFRQTFSKLSTSRKIYPLALVFRGQRPLITCTDLVITSPPAAASPGGGDHVAID